MALYLRYMCAERSQFGELHATKLDRWPAAALGQASSVAKICGAGCARDDPQAGCVAVCESG